MSLALRCTVRGCGQPLVVEDVRLICPRGHAFDRAREGYWNLLQPQDRRSSAAGDRDHALGARRRWLRLGLLDGLAEALSRAIDARTSEATRAIADVGCGEGTLTARLFASRGVDVYGVDLSATAIAMAARLEPRFTWIVANADRGLPFVDGSIDVAISIFGRRPAAELARVVASGGTLLVVLPGEDDLLELREAAQGEAVRRDRLAAALAELAPRFVPIERSSWRGRAYHDRAAIEDALAMSYRGSRFRERERLATVDAMEVTLAADVVVLVSEGGVR